MDTSVKRGDIYYADLSPVVGSEQGGVRPVLIIQNDTGNRYSPTVIAAAITSQTGKARLPTHIDLPVDQSCGLSRDSIVLLEQVRTLDKKRLRERMGHVEEHVMQKVDTSIAVSFGLPHDHLVGVKAPPEKNGSFWEELGTKDFGGTYEKEQMAGADYGGAVAERSAEYDGNSGVRRWDRR